MRYELPEPGRPSGRRQAPRRRRRVVACVSYRVGGRGDGVLRRLGRRGLGGWLRGVGQPKRVTGRRRSKKDAEKKRGSRRGCSTTAQAICADSASHVAMTIETLWRFVAGVRVGVVRVERAAQLEVELVGRLRSCVPTATACRASAGVLRGLRRISSWRRGSGPLEKAVTGPARVDQQLPPAAGGAGAGAAAAFPSRSPRRAERAPSATRGRPTT